MAHRYRLLAGLLSAVLVGIISSPARAQRFTKDEAASIVENAKGSYTTVQWRSRWIAKDGKDWGVVDGEAFPGEFLDPKTGQTRKMVGHLVKVRVERDGSTVRPYKDEAEKMVNGMAGVTILWRNKYVDKSGKDWDVVDGEAYWSAFLDPSTKKKVEMVGHRIKVRVEKDGSTVLPYRPEAEQMVNGVLGLTIRWRNKYADKAGKDWDVVDGEASWGLFQEPESKRYETTVGLELFRRVHRDGSTSAFSTDEAEQMVKGTKGVGVLTRNGLVGWKPAPLDLPAVPESPTPKNETPPKSETPAPGTETPAKPKVTPPTTDQKEPQSAPADAGPTNTSGGSRMGWSLAGFALVVGCGVAVALFFLLRRKNTEKDSSASSRDSDSESESERPVQEAVKRSVICPSCRAKLKVPTGLAKKKVRCPKCSAQLTLR